MTFKAVLTRSSSHRKADLPGVQPGKNQMSGKNCLHLVKMVLNLLYEDVSVCVCIHRAMSIHVHTCSAIPAPGEDDAELGDDNNDKIAFNTLGRVYKQTYVGTHVTTSLPKCTVLALTCVKPLALCGIALMPLIAGSALHRGEHGCKSAHKYVNRNYWAVKRKAEWSFFISTTIPVFALQLQEETQAQSRTSCAGHNVFKVLWDGSYLKELKSL